MLDFLGRLIGSGLDTWTASENRSAQKEMAERNIQMQKEFAQQGIRWKVEDAKAAGIHPLYALGASSHSFSPVSIGSLPESNYSSTFGAMGQDLSRAVNATRTQDEREQAFTDTARSLELEGKKLDNDIKRAQIASSTARLTQTPNPPLPAELPQKEPEGVSRLYSGGPLEADRGVSDAQEWENRYGELADWLIGPYIMYKDYIANYSLRPERRVNLWEKMRRERLPRDSFKARFGKWSK